MPHQRFQRFDYNSNQTSGTNIIGPQVLKSAFLTLSQTTNFRLFQTDKSLQTTISNLLKMVESSPKRKKKKRRKLLWEKKKLLVTSNFFFSHSIIKRIVLKTRKNKSLFAKRSSCDTGCNQYTIPIM